MIVLTFPYRIIPPYCVFLLSADIKPSRTNYISHTQNSQSFVAAPALLRMHMLVTRQTCQTVKAHSLLKRRGSVWRFFPCYACGRLRYVPQPSLSLWAEAQARHLSIAIVLTHHDCHPQAGTKKNTHTVPLASKSTFVLQFSVFYLSEGSEKKGVALAVAAAI